MSKQFSIDPLPDIAPALLNSADIQAYQAVCELVRGEPFRPVDLKAASYKILCKGTIFWTNECGERKSERISGDEVFTLNPNSIAFVSPDAEFHLPDFMAARFNLSISLVHQGLLLGTGPLIDPGFHGRLLIPIHNLTTKAVNLKASGGLIQVEFTKLSPGYERGLGSRRYEFVRSFKNGELGGPPERYFDKTGGVPTQSTLHKNAEIWEREITKVRELQDSASAQEKRLRNYSIFGGLIGAAGILALVVSVYQSYLASVAVAQQAYSTVDQVRQSMAQADKAASAASEAIGELSARLAKLEKGIVVSANPAASSKSGTKR